MKGLHHFGPARVCVAMLCLALAWSPPLLAKRKATLEKSLAAAAPRANPRVIRLALKAAACADRLEQSSTQRLAVIDYSRPSTQRRLWVFDLARRKLVFEEWVAHGRNSGGNYPRHFSNELDSLTSSLGLFRTLETYDGEHGYSLTMTGLEPGVNDRAEERALVLHSAPYVSRKSIRMLGRLGRSLGCPAVRPEVGPRLIDSMKDGQYIFAYYPDRRWLASSKYLNCASPAPAPAGRTRSAH